MLASSVPDHTFASTLLPAGSPLELFARPRRVWFAAFLFSVWGLCPAFSAPTRPLAVWPPPAGSLRVIIDTDAGTEIDDQYALALALGASERIHLEGVVAAHFGDSGGSEGIQRSCEEIQRVFAKAGTSKGVPILRGAQPFSLRDQPPDSEGVRFIIDKARTATPETPLWLVMIGPATDGVAALLRDSSIADRIVIVWHGRTQWPARCWNFNAFNDIKAARILFELPCRFVLFDTGTYLRISVEDTARRFAPLGPLGAYLYSIRSRHPGYLSLNKAMFDLGDITALVDPASVRSERTQAPFVDYDLRYDFSKPQGEIVRIYYVDRDRAFDLLETALRRVSGNK